MRSSLEGNMPIYEDQCTKCGFVNEHLSKFTDQTVPCPKCGSESERLYSLAAVSIFEGFDTRNIDRHGRNTRVSSKRELSSLCHENGVIPVADAPPPPTKIAPMKMEVPKW
jgi:putative FmdB family regulatory protein